MRTAPWIAGLVVAALCRLPYIDEAQQLDLSVYLVIGDGWLHGLVPYRDLFDIKGPLTFELGALLSALPHSLVLLRLLALVWFAVGLIALQRLVDRHATPPTSMLACVVLAIAGSSVVYQGEDINTEQLALPFLLLAMERADASAGRGRTPAAVAGAMIACAAAMKPTYGLFGLVCLGLLLWPRTAGAGRAVTAMAAGGLAATVAIVLPYAFAGAAGDVATAMFTDAPRYTRESWQDVAELPTREQIRFALALPAPWFVALALSLGLVGMRDREHRRLALTGAGLVLVGYVVARSTGRTYDHYFHLLMPGLALLAGIGLSVLRRSIGSAGVLALIATVAVGLIATPFRESVVVPHRERESVYRNSADARIKRAAELVAAVTRPGERIYVATGGPLTNSGQLAYWYADRRPATRQIAPYSLAPTREAETARDLARNPPAAIIVMPSAPAGEIAEAVRLGGLRIVSRVDTSAHNPIVVYGRRAAPREFVPLGG